MNFKKVFFVLLALLSIIVVFCFVRESKSVDLQKIKLLKTHASGTTAYVENGKQVKAKFSEDMLHQQTLKVIDPKHKTKNIFTIPLEKTEFYGSIDALTFSHAGKYLLFTETGYESSRPHIINLSTGTDILANYWPDIWYYDSEQNIIWSGNDEYFVIKSYHNEVGGEGELALYVNNPLDPKELIKIMALTQPEYVTSAGFSQIFMIDNAVSFTVERRNYVNSIEQISHERYNFDIISKNLTRI